jgi:hypothetical protein
LEKEKWISKISDDGVGVDSTEVQVKKRQSAMTLQVLLQLSTGLQQPQGRDEIQMHSQLAHFRTHVLDEVRRLTDTFFFEKVRKFNQVVLNDVQLL